ncbi:uncharacterized protein METZ01_LOCUS500821, partial [marine metagenome]
MANKGIRYGLAAIFDTAKEIYDAAG